MCAAEQAIASRRNRLWPWLAASVVGHGLLLAAWLQLPHPGSAPAATSNSAWVSVEMLPALEPVKSESPEQRQEAAPVRRLVSDAGSEPQKQLARAEAKEAPHVTDKAKARTVAGPPQEPVQAVAVLPPTQEIQSSPVANTEKTPAEVSHARAEQIEPVKQPVADNDTEQVNRLVRHHLESFKFYPGGARRRGIEGHVDVGFTLTRRGEATAVTVLQGSGYAVLDRAALETVSRAQPFPVADGTFRFRLNFRRL